MSTNTATIASALPEPRPRDPLREGLVLLCHYLGHPMSMAELGDGLPLIDGRLSPHLAPQALRRAGIAARIVKMDLAHLHARLLPALILLSDGNALLWVRQEQQQAIVLDPATGGGEHAMDLAALQALYSGQSILARPRYRPDDRAEGFAAAPPQHWLKDTLKSQWRDYGSVALAAFMANLLAIASSLFALQVYDRVVPNVALDTLWLLASGALIAILFEFVLRNLRAHTLETLGKRIDLQMSSRIFSKVLQMRLQSRPASIGSFSNQVKEFESIRDFFTSSTAATISDLPFVLLFIFIVYLIGGPVAWIPLIACALILLVGLAAQGRLAALSRQNLREGAIKSGILLEAISQLETVKTTRAEGRMQLQWDRLSAELAAASVKSRTLTTALSYGSSLLQQLCYVGVVIVGVYQISEGHMTTGALVACSMLAGRAIAPMSQVANILTRWQHVKLAVNGLDQIMALPVERTPGRKFARRHLLTGSYELNEVRCRYEAEGPIAVDIPHLQIRAGEKVCLLGSNGAGKSTLLRFLAGLTSPDDGQIKLDDLAISQIDPFDLRHNIGYLPQDVALFYGTLRDNLTPANEGQTDEEMLHALDAVGLGDFVRSHPRGLDMQIQASHSVSGGQRQAIGLARLLLQDPRIVLMDEPTAAFDQDSETHVIQYLKQWLQSRTLVISTHKRAMLALTERVIVMRKGRVIMDGPLQETVKGHVVHLPGNAP